MDTTDGKIKFDEAGVCDHCRTFSLVTLPKWERDLKDEGALGALVDKIKREGQDKPFDCILGVSGGVDSSYLTHLAKVELGLRPLVFHVDAGWNSQEAVNNIEVLVDKLGLELFTEVINWEEMRDLQLSMFKAGVPHLDLPQDMAFFGTMYKFAHKHKIKHILTGGNLSTECVRNPIEWIYYADSVHLRDIHRKYGQRQLDTFPITNILWHKVYLPYFKGIKVWRPLNMMPYVKESAVDLLEKRYGWQRYPQKHFESRFTRFYEGYWLPEKFGYDTRKVQYSSLILTGQMTRQQALERLQKPALDPATARLELEYVAAKLRISVEELNGYFNAPNRTYKDYRSLSGLFKIGAAVMKLVGLEVGGKR
jgi:N-acetyl sugar amidotransferase